MNRVSILGNELTVRQQIARLEFGRRDVKDKGIVGHVVNLMCDEMDAFNPGFIFADIQFEGDFVRR